jgi:RNA polymerase sigma-70 factor (ECF subfamily)
MVDDEMTLLARARALDDEALAEIHDRYYEPIFRYIVFRVSNQQVAEDLASEVFVRLLSALRDHTAPQNTIRGWLYGVAFRVVNDFHRKQYRREEVQLNDGIASDISGPLETVAKHLSWREVRAAMAGLTEPQREVIALRFGQEMPIRDVAQLLGKTEGAVKQLQARAIASLARTLKEMV